MIKSALMMGALALTISITPTPSFASQAEKVENSNREDVRADTVPGRHICHLFHLLPTSLQPSFCDQILHDPAAATV